ncbi:MAG: hypothetical protein PHG05_00235 [Candidatus Nanoarchaeia archaeon]|nr:hypothetical protein [Candidatus Nanoarchaeia archaeon]
MNKKNFCLSRFIGGVIFCLSSAILIFFENNIPVPVKISLLVVGMALIATSKQKLLK